jgi:arylsulfatase A-like enzyme
MEDVRDEVLAPYPRTPEDTRRQLAEYYAMITHLDHAIGRIIAALEAKGVYENTIIVFAGDNGLAVGQHGLFGKQNHYEHSVRVPLIFAGPGIPANERRDQYAYLLDIFPTLCDLLEMERPASVEGKSLAGVIADESAPAVREELYFALMHLLRGYKDDRHKIVLSAYRGENRVQLFDVVDDPWELTDLAGDPESDRLIADLYERLCAYRDRWDDRASTFGTEFWDAFDANGGITTAVRG